MKKRKIIYVNFAPYDNAGRILDFLIENFSVVVHFSYDHLRLKNGRRSQLFVYENRKQVAHKNLLWMRTPRPFLFLSLPLVAFAIIWQTYWEILMLKKKYGTFDLFFTANAYTAWIGNILRKIHLVKKTIFWVWDYFPPHFPDWRLRLARKIYLRFDNPAINHSDKVIFLNRRLAKVRKDLNIISNINDHEIIPIGTNPTTKKPSSKKMIIGHMGMLKWGQGLDFLFDTLPELTKKVKNLKVEIIGSGPDEFHYRKRAKKIRSKIKFYGFVQSDNEIDRLIRRWDVGIATYVPNKSSEHYWGDPSKIKAYISQGIPAITTNVSYFASELKRVNAGKIIKYGNQEEFITSIKDIIKKQKTYKKNALKLARKYHYKKIYPKMFNV